MEAEGHVITYHEPDEDLPTVDWILYWESPITHDSEYGPAYKKVKNSPQKKALLFSGGPIKKEWVDGFDHIFVESKINADEFDALGIRNSTAFGVNTDVFRPTMEHKAYKTVTHGTCASWKRQWLVCEALGDQALVFGRPQEADPRPFDECRKCGSTVLLGQSYQETARLINSAQVGVNCADFWGGGQRATLEAMACGLPVVVMEDSPKNREYVEDGGLGFICPPQADAIRATVDEALALSTDQKLRAREYVMSKWTAEHYKDNLLNAL
jgi:glycosyltransferase involved in cell wall biosynthesis